MGSLIPVVLDWSANAAMWDLAAREKKCFVVWTKQLPITQVQRLVLNVLLEKVDSTDFIDGRCAGFTYPAEIDRRAGIPTGNDEGLSALTNCSYLSMRPVAEQHMSRTFLGLRCRNRASSVRGNPSIGLDTGIQVLPRSSESSDLLRPDQRFMPGSSFPSDFLLESRQKRSWATLL